MLRKKHKTIKDSQVEMIQLVLPDDTNQFGNLLGGRLMQWIDIAAAIAAFRHTNKVCVTASVDELHFLHPVKQGEVVILKASVNRVFNTSLEIGVRAEKENLLSGKRQHTSSAYLTFVAINKKGKPVKVNPIQPETSIEKRRYEQAEERRKTRLLYLSKQKAS